MQKLEKGELLGYYYLPKIKRVRLLPQSLPQNLCFFSVAKFFLFSNCHFSREGEKEQQEKEFQMGFEGRELKKGKKSREDLIKWAGLLYCFRRRHGTQEGKKG